MFPSEAAWIARCLENIPSTIGQQDQVLNLGSSTWHYRTVHQPYIDEIIFRPMKQKFSFVHVDAKSGPGIDLSGDFCSEAFWQDIETASYDVIICSNVLTHVVDRDTIVRNIRRTMKDGAYLVVTSPEVYPYCADPFDSKFRPTCQELADLFKGFTMIEAMTASTTERHINRLLTNPRNLASFLANVLLPRKGLERWKNVLSDTPRLFSKLRTSCVLMRLER